jgi:thioredoxin-like negative regulator of GroEL
VAARVPRDIMMASANVGSAGSLAARYGIQGTPTTLFLSTGTEVNRLEGKLGADELLAAIQAAFPASFQAKAPAGTPPTPSPQKPAPTAPQAPALVQTAPGPGAGRIVAGVVAIALALTGVALIVGRKD